MWCVAASDCRRPRLRGEGCEMNYFCCDQDRRARLADPKTNDAGLNGIDYVEVLDLELEGQAAMCQRRLKVHFINELEPELELGPDHIVIEGGERIRNIQVNQATVGSEPNVLEIDVDQPGDFCTYT